MNKQEASVLLAFLSAPYGGSLGPEAAEAWFHSALKDRPFEESMDVVRGLVASSEFRPTPAQFNGAWRQRQLTPPVVEVPALEPGPDAGAGEVPAMIAEMRAMLRSHGVESSIGGSV